MKICVATDLEPGFERLVDHASEWAKAHQATLVLLHVVHDPELAPALSNDVPGDLQRAQTQLEEVAERIDPSCTVDVRPADKVGPEILKATEDADYVFMGSQGKSALERMRLGSVVTSVIRNSRVPIVCHPHTTEET